MARLWRERGSFCYAGVVGRYGWVVEGMRDILLCGGCRRIWMVMEGKRKLLLCGVAGRYRLITEGKGDFLLCGIRSDGEALQENLQYLRCYRASTLGEYTSRVLQNHKE